MYDKLRDLRRRSADAQNSQNDRSGIPGNGEKRSSRFSEGLSETAIFRFFVNTRFARSSVVACAEHFTRRQWPPGSFLQGAH